MRGKGERKRRKREEAIRKAGKKGRGTERSWEEESRFSSTRKGRKDFPS